MWFVVKIQHKAIVAGAAAGAVAIPLVLARTLGKGPQRDIQAEPQRSPSYWMATIPPIESFPQLSGEITVDVAVVGGGFTGLATAYYLKRHDPSISVALLEAQKMGSGSSTRNTGGVGRQLRGQESTDATQRGYDLIRSFEEREELPFDLNEEVPALRLHRTSETIMDPDLVGNELARQIGSSFYQAAEAFTASSLHPGKFITSLVHANRQLGVDLYERSPVTAIEKDHGKPVLVTPGGRVRAGDVVLATNAFTPQLGIATDQLLVMHHRVIVTQPLSDAEWELSGLGRWSMRMEHGTYYTHTVRATPDRRFFFRHVLGTVQWRRSAGISMTGISQSDGASCCGATRGWKARRSTSAGMGSPLAHAISGRCWARLTIMSTSLPVTTAAESCRRTILAISWLAASSATTTQISIN